MSDGRVPVECLMSRYLDPLGNNWIPQLQTKIREFENPRWAACLDRWDEASLSSLGLAITIKSAILGRIVERTDMLLRSLDVEIRRDPDRLQHALRSGTTYRIDARYLEMDIIVYLESFVFESHSIFELLIKFFKKFYSLFLCRRFYANNPQNFSRYLASRGHDVHWMNVLDRARNAFIHEQAPWIEIEVESTDPLVWSMCVTSAHPTPNSESDVHLPFRDLQSIYNGLVVCAANMANLLDQDLRRAATNV